MSMPTTCINVDVDYFTHPKTKRLIGLLGKGSEVLPIQLWCWCAKYHAESGLLAGYSAEEIESCVGWWGEKGRFVEAMIKVGLIEQSELGFYVHDFTNLNGHISAFKERARKAADARWAGVRAAKECSSNATSIAKPMLEQSPNQLTNYLPTTSTAAADEAADVDNSKPKDPDPAEERPAAVPAAPGQDLEQVIYDRIGHKKRLSRFDVDKILKLRREHSDTFYPAVDKLHGRVTNVPAFLEKVCLGLAKERDEPAGVKVCRKCGHKWDPWKSGKSLCPVCYPEPGQQAAKITPLVQGLSTKMGMTA